MREIGTQPRPRVRVLFGSACDSTKRTMASAMSTPDAASMPSSPGEELTSITIGPVLYYGSRETLMHFYAEVAESPADTVTLGEVVCSRRHEMRTADWLDLAARRGSSAEVH